MEFLLVRHGQSTSNADEDGKLDSNPLGGPITELGREQSLNAGLFLRSYEASLTTIHSSPQIRCLETARHIRLGAAEVDTSDQVSVITDEDVSVRGLGSAIGKNREYRRKFPTYDSIPNSESTAAFITRVSNYFFANTEEDGRRRIVVTHSGVISLVRFLTANPELINNPNQATPDCYRAGYGQSGDSRIPNASVWRLHAEGMEMLFKPQTNDLA